MLSDLVRFARRHHPGFAEVSEAGLQKLFETYSETTLVYQEGGEVKGFAIYQEWPDCLNVIAIAGVGSPIENLSRMLRGSRALPDKPIVFYDEETHKLRVLHNASISAGSFDSRDNRRGCGDVYGDRGCERGKEGPQAS